MLKHLTFGDIDTRDFGVWITGTGRLHIPEHVYEMVAVPGRMGDVPIDQMRVGNKELVYPAIFAPPYGNYHSLNEAVGAFRTRMLSIRGYAEIHDTYDVTHYWKGVYAGGVDVEPSMMLDAASFDLVFNVSPQTFIYLPTIEIPGAASLTKTELSLTQFPANIANLDPIITVGGTGDARITFVKHGEPLSTGTIHSIYLTRSSETVIINSQLKECYTSTGSSANGLVQFSDYQFPRFGAFYGYAGQVDVYVQGAVGSTITIEPGGYQL